MQGDFYFEMTMREASDQLEPIRVPFKGSMAGWIVNVLDNAIKYNHEGGQVDVHVTCNQVRVQVSICDTGRGILPKGLGMVFDKFYRGQNDEEGGAGLGLSIARKIVEAHGGDMWVQSVVGIGSTFTFSLPLLDDGGR